MTCHFVALVTLFFFFFFSTPNYWFGDTLGKQASVDVHKLGNLDLNVFMDMVVN